MTTYHQRAYATALRSLLRPGTRWLDLGAGSRIHGAWDADPLPVQPIGCDPSPTGMRHNADLRSRVVALHPLPFRSGAFDLISANMVLEHLRDPASTLAEVARCLAPGGRFVAVTPHRRHWIVRAVSLLPKPLRRWLGRAEGRAAADVFETHYRANTSRDLYRLAAVAGLTAQVVAFRSTPAGSRLERLLWWLTLPGPPSNLLVEFRKPAPVPLRAGWQSGAAFDNHAAIP